MPWRVRLGQFVIRARIAREQLRRWWVNPAPAPEQIGKQGARAFDKRPAAIEIGFYLHADGKVYIRDRRGGGDIRCDIPEVKQLVHDQYRVLIDQHRKRFEQRGRILRRLRQITSRQKDLDTTEQKGAS